MPRPDLVRLTRAAERPRPELRLGPDAALALGRAHELCGPARRAFAAMIAGGLAGPVLWILPEWEAERPAPQGLVPFFDPARLTLALVRRAADILWTAEEALRSGACPLVIAETEPPALTPVRRLHLAAETGAERGTGAPLMLLLTPGEGGAQGVETRWRAAPTPGWAGDPAPGGSRPTWRLERLRARAAPPVAWEMRWRPGRAEGGAAGQAELARSPAPPAATGA